MKTRPTSRAYAAEACLSMAGGQPAKQLRPAAAAVMPDGRTVSLAQQWHQEQASSSTQAAQLRAHADLMAGGGADAPVQRVEDEEPRQRKFDVTQGEEDEELLQGKFEAYEGIEQKSVLVGDRTQIKRPVPYEEQNNRVSVVQLVRFKRFSGWRRAANWINSSQEDELHRQEKRVREFIDEMNLYHENPFGRSLRFIEMKLPKIEKSVIDTEEYESTLNLLNSLYDQLNKISNAIAVGLKIFTTRYNGLPADQAWRESVDLNHQKHGEHVYDTGAHHTPRIELFTEPGASKKITAARTHVVETLGTTLTVEKYRRINELAAPDNVKSAWRNESSNIEVGVAKNTSVEGRNRLMTLDMAPTLRHDGEKPGRGELLVSSFGADNSRIALVPRAAAEVQDMVNDILQKYYRKIESARNREVRLKIVAETHQLLERLHAFRDANTRTNLLVLNKFLTEQGYHPVILDDPNTSYLVSTEDWIIKIEQGLKRWEDLRDGKSSAVPAVLDSDSMQQEQEHKSGRIAGSFTDGAGSVHETEIF